MTLPLSWMSAAAALLASCVGAHAQAWPGKLPIKVIVPFPAGASTDTIGRPVLDHVAKQIGQSYVWENRPGAGGTIGMAAVAKADPDGYTIMVNSSVQTIVSLTYANLRFDPMKEIAGVAPLAQFPNALVAPSQRYKSVQDLVAAGKSKPGSLTYGSGGVGAATHLNAERLRLSAGFEAVHVPFKGAPEVLREIVAGRLDFAFSPLASALPLIEGKEVQALAVSGLKRAPELPDVPTTLEAGYPGSDYVFWLGVFAPAGTPADIVERLSRSVQTALADPAVRNGIVKLGADPMAQTPSQFEAFLRTDLERNAAIVKAAGIKPN